MDTLDIKLVALGHAVSLGIAAAPVSEVTSGLLVEMAREFETYLKGGDDK